jgi:hypothetical protein
METKHLLCCHDCHDRPWDQQVQSGLVLVYRISVLFPIPISKNSMPGHEANIFLGTVCRTQGEHKYPHMEAP